MRDDSHIQALLHEAACYESEAAQHKNSASEQELYAAIEKARPFYLLRPRLFPDGNQWCALYGDNLQEGVCAFGDTPAQAAVQFDLEWLNARAGTAHGIGSQDATKGSQ